MGTKITLSEDTSKAQPAASGYSWGEPAFTVDGQNTSTFTIRDQQVVKVSLTNTTTTTSAPSTTYQLPPTASNPPGYPPATTAPPTTTQQLPPSESNPPGHRGSAEHPGRSTDDPGRPGSAHLNPEDADRWYPAVGAHRCQHRCAPAARWCRCGWWSPADGSPPQGLLNAGHRFSRLTASSREPSGPRPGSFRGGATGVPPSSFLGCWNGTEA